MQRCDIPAEILEYHRLHTQEGLSCRAISRMIGREQDYVSYTFRRYGLKLARTNNKPKKSTMVKEYTPPEQMRVRLAIRDGVYHVFEIDQDGNRLGRGVPASPYEIALWRECRKWIKQVV